MENKYLPIGTVCTLKNNNKKIMIISYFSLEYNGNVKIYDYKGCVYPEGLLLPSQAISFNHEDIENVEYMGFKNEQFEVFNNTLNRDEETEGTQYEKKEVMSNFKFDENGVVIFDGSVSENEPETLDIPATSISNSNPFMAQTNYMADEEINNSMKPDIFEFDENGVVISDNSARQTNKSQSRYQFDENGFVIGEVGIEESTVNGMDITKEVLKEENKTSANFKFDENGIVIEDDTITNQQPEQLTSNIQFDENGFVISE